MDNISIGHFASILQVSFWRISLRFWKEIHCLILIGDRWIFSPEMVLVVITTCTAKKAMPTNHKSKVDKRNVDKRLLLGFLLLLTWWFPKSTLQLMCVDVMAFVSWWWDSGKMCFVIYLPESWVVECFSSAIHCSYKQVKNGVFNAMLGSCSIYHHFPLCTARLCLLWKVSSVKIPWHAMQCSWKSRLEFAKCQSSRASPLSVFSRLSQLWGSHTIKRLLNRWRT